MSQLHITTQTNAEVAPSIWRNRNFLILFVTGIIIEFGSKVYELALPLILFEKTHSAATMGTMRAIEFLPNLLFAMFIGVFVDRVNKKRWIQLTVTIQMLVLIGLYALARFGHASIYHFYIAGFVLMTLYYAYGNAKVSIVKQVLPTQLLISANAKFSFTTTLIGIMGPAISGFILLLANLYDGLLLTALSFLLAIGSTSFLKAEEERKTARDSSFWQDLRDGWRVLLSNRPLWLITILVIFLNSTSGMYDAMVIFFAKDTLKLDNSVLGLALSAAGLGGLLGSVLVGHARQRFQTGRLLGLTILGDALAYLVMFFAPNVWVMMLSLLLEGLFGTMSSVCIWTFRQESTPSGMIGRISGITGSIFKLGMVFTIFGSGWVAELFHASYVFLGAAIMSIGIFIAYRNLSLWHLR
ncbi:MFS transporter [Brevibacillus fluminis]|uniref:MFS transporter n=1 Tax=Brevibacillus fluminis TaxID=511487 RepID=A0A3M8DWW1_9BACL|nr:MFS transporter [Brevibacillus fluminis]RNB92015.1 MFS transporter [Brevibacillus fluminis]